MAKKNGVNKSQAVREYFKANPQAKNQEVIEALAKKGITVTANYVSNIKATHNKRKKARSAVVAKGGVAIADVKAALVLLKLTGNMEAAKKALAVAQEIRAIV